MSPWLVMRVELRKTYFLLVKAYIRNYKKLFRFASLVLKNSVVIIMPRIFSISAWLMLFQRF